MLILLGTLLQYSVDEYISLEGGDLSRADRVLGRICALEDIITDLNAGSLPEAALQMRLALAALEVEDQDARARARRLLRSALARVDAQAGLAPDDFAGSFYGWPSPTPPSGGHPRHPAAP